MSVISSYRFCPICDKMQNVLLCEEEAVTKVAQVPVKYLELRYKCPTTNETFMNTNLINQNILRARNSYNQLQGIA